MHLNSNKQITITTASLAQIVHNDHQLRVYTRTHLRVGVQSILDLVDIVIRQTSEANCVVADRNGIALVELASEHGGKVHASLGQTADNHG